MTKFFSVAALFAVGFAQSAVAGEVTGGSLGFTYSAFSDDSAATVDKKSIAGSVEYAFDRQFALQGDLSLVKFGATDLDGHSYTLHGIYHLDDATSFGAFIGRDEVDSVGETFYGLEIGREFDQLDTEGYIAHGQADDLTGTLFGLSALYNATDSFAFGMRYDTLDIDTVEASRVSLLTEYEIDRVVLSAEVGQADINGVGSESFFGVGARMTFGADRGTTFEKRGLLDVIPGL